MTLPTVAVYPGSFDPPTLGHVSLVERGLEVFDRIIVAVAANPQKEGLFSVAERLELLRESLAHLPRGKTEVDGYEGLTVEYAAKKGATAILRGLRAISDFEYEFRMSMMNSHLRKNVQSVFLMADREWSFTSSSIVKEAAALGADISDLVPAPVAKKLALLFGGKKSGA
jgi:pantetheine-phosphate adenylyltransferase